MDAMGRGIIDWSGQFKALKRDGYHLAVSLETHWRGAAHPRNRPGRVGWHEKTVTRGRAISQESEK